MVEHQPSKLDTWVRFPSPALMAQWLSWLERRPVTAEVTGSSPVWVVCSKYLLHSLYGILAQLGEHLPYKQRVTGSSPVGPIIRRCGSIGRAADL